MSVNLIQLDRVSKNYGDQCAVDAITLTVFAGEILALLGGSGCGKTTTLRLIAGLELPDSGSIRLDGQIVADRKVWIPPEKRGIGIVFQDYALFPHLSVRANVAFPLAKSPRGERERWVRDLLALVGLGEYAERYPHELSGGQQQRVALARALAGGPKLILLDEPFSNLDAALRATTRAEVRRILKEAGATAVFVTHDQEEAMGLADRIGVLKAGQLLQIGTPRALYQRPTSPEVATFMGSANHLEGIGQGDYAECALGRLPIHQPVTGPAHLFIRPETLRVDPSGEIVSTLEDVRYLGGHQTLHARAANGLPLMIDAPPFEIFSPGELLRLRLEGPALAFPAERAASFESPQ